jgi:hypothetical protein
MSLAEVLVSLAIVSVIVVYTGRLLSTALRATQDNVNKQFATQKALSILEELRAVLQRQDGATTIVLDAFDDGVTNQPVLTIQSDVTDPANPVSGNRIAGTQWLYSRRITVQRFPGSSDLRLVNVKVFVNEGTGTRLLAEVASVLSTIGGAMPPTQVYDTYLIAIENIPGWWVHMQNVVPFVESAMNDLESRHPGLQFRRHWIRKLSYGRDPLYAPFINSAADSTQPVQSVYFYPGLLPTGYPVQYYYPPDFFNARVNIDGAVTNGYDAATNPLPYALADQYNHAMRYPDELALFQARVAAGQETADAPTFRLLLDDMYARPSLYRNAIVINLHGELFPFPPVRNYSDAARDPALYPNVRAVTHAERLRYANTDAVRLRVYSYHTAPNAATVPDWLGRNGTATPITITVKGLSWIPAPNAVTAISGGVDFDGNTQPDVYTTIAAPIGTTANAMYWTYELTGTDTVFHLYNSPLKTPCATTTATACASGGLDPSRRLYGLEYIPAPVENLPDGASPAAFTTTLETAGTAVKNTARWIINIPTFVLPSDAMVTIETRLGTDLTTGTAFPAVNAPRNLSRTYFWRGTDTWLFGDATHDPNLPLTERFQIIGDPRHCPYADLKNPHLASGRVRADRLGMGYNRYFDDFDTAGANSGAAWPGWSYDAPALSGTWYGVKNNTSDNTDNNDGWNTRDGMIELDVPRIYEVLRSAVVRSNAIYTTMTGFSYYYVGIGGEIGYDDANGFPNSVPVSSRPFTGGNGWQYEQSIIDGARMIRENATGSYWWGMSWLGELTPDSAWNTWLATGNLPTGTGAGTFSRVSRSSITPNLPTGTVFFDGVRRTQEEGSTTFFWSGSARSTFHHRSLGGTTGNLVAEGLAIAANYEVPLADSISNDRPFNVNIDDTGTNPDHFLQPVYGAATTLQPLAEFYRHTTNIPGSALLAMRDGSESAFVVVNGLSPAGDSGTAFISRWSFLSLVHSFLSAGLYTNAGVADPRRVRELPRVAITAPNDTTDIDNPSTLRVQWQSSWRRWDGLSYTPAYPANWADDTTIRFARLYSRDNGRTWLHMQDDTAATPGVRPANAYLSTTTQYDWSVPANRFPRGNYLLRIEAYRDEVPLHYAFHQFRAFFKRT